jgi:Transposase DDE domain
MTRSTPEASASSPSGYTGTPFDPARVEDFCRELFLVDVHAKRVQSLANGVVGVIQSAALAVHLIGQGLAQAKGLQAKHAIKQVDGLLDNPGLVMSTIFRLWIGFVLAQRTEAMVLLDWTDFDKDGHTTLVLSLVTTHGRATALIWKTVPKRGLKNKRTTYEDDLLTEFKDLLPEGVRVTVLADRGFCDQKLYRFLKDELGFDYIIRFRANILVETRNGNRRARASAFVPKNGRPCRLQRAKVTVDRYEVPVVILVKDKGMKEAWCLASSRTNMESDDIVGAYGCRFTTEETFRDDKDPRFGLGLSSTHVGTCARRDRLLLLAALAHSLLTLLGAAAEATGLDRTMKHDTRKSRVHSLFRQGLYWYGAIPAMKTEQLELLMNAFAKILSEHEIFSKLFHVL